MNSHKTHHDPNLEEITTIFFIIYYMIGEKDYIEVGRIS